MIVQELDDKTKLWEDEQYDIIAQTNFVLTLFVN